MGEKGDIMQKWHLHTFMLIINLKLCFFLLIWSPPTSELFHNWLEGVKLNHNNYKINQWEEKFFHSDERNSLSGFAYECLLSYTII